MPRPLAKTSTKSIALREAQLVAYQDRAYAQRYRDLVDRVRRGRAAACSRQHRADRGRGAQLSQAARLQGRVRGRPAVQRSAVQETAAGHASTATTSSRVHLAPRCCRASTRPPASRASASSGRGSSRCCGCSRVSKVCAARRSTRSATPPSAGWSAGSSPTMKREVEVLLRRLTPRHPCVGGRNREAAAEHPWVRTRQAGERRAGPQAAQRTVCSDAEGRAGGVRAAPRPKPAASDERAGEEAVV